MATIGLQEMIWLLLLFPARSAHHATGFGTGMFSVLENLNAIHKNVPDSGGILVWIFKSGVVLNFRRVENNDVGKITGFERASAFQLKILRRK